MAITNSKQQKLSTPEVITHALANEHQAKRLPEGVSLQAALLAVTKELTLENAKQQQIGNTVFIAHYGDDGKEVYMRALNVDTARNYVENSIAYAKALAAEGVERLVSDFKGDTVRHVFETIAKQDFAADWGMKIFQMKDGGYRVYAVMKGA